MKVAARWIAITLKFSHLVFKVLVAVTRNFVSPVSQGKTTRRLHIEKEHFRMCGLSVGTWNTADKLLTAKVFLYGPDLHRCSVCRVSHIIIFSWKIEKLQWKIFSILHLCKVACAQYTSSTQQSMNISLPLVVHSLTCFTIKISKHCLPSESISSNIRGWSQCVVSVTWLEKWANEQLFLASNITVSIISRLKQANQVIWQTQKQSSSYLM